MNGAPPKPGHPVVYTQLACYVQAAREQAESVARFASIAATDHPLLSGHTRETAGRMPAARDEEITNEDQ